MIDRGSHSRATRSAPERIDVDTTVPHRLNAVDDFKAPARGVVRIRKVTFGGVLHALRSAFAIIDDRRPRSFWDEDLAFSPERSTTAFIDQVLGGLLC